MNRKDLDALNELYLSVYDGEQLNEAPVTGFRPVDRLLQGTQAFFQGNPRPTGTVDRQIQTAQNYRDAGGVGVPPPNWKPGQPTKIVAKSQPPKPTEKPVKPTEKPVKPTEKPVKPTENPQPQQQRQPATTPRPAASSTVLAKRKGVEGRLDKATGKFTTGTFSAAEKSRYSSVAAQNAARTSASSGAAAPTPARTPAAATPAGPAKPAIGTTPGGTKFERRTPTSSELRAAQAARAEGKGEEGAVKAGVEQGKADNIVKSGAVAALKPAAPTPSPAPARNGFGASTAPMVAKSSVSSATGINNKKPITPVKQESYEWPSAKTIRDIAGAYSSIYEAKKKVDQDQDGDNDFADVRVARMIASGVPKAKAIAMVKNKSYNEEVELWVNELLEEGYDLSEYTWEDMFEIYEATAMAKRGYDETEIRNKIAKSTGGGKFADKATALADRQTYGNKSKKEAREKLARTQRGDFRRTTSSNPGLHGYAYKSNDPAVKAKQAARGAQRGVLTPNEKKELNREAYEAYEFVASYLLENNFASTVDDANVIINNMSEGWFESIMEEKKPLPVAKMKRKESKLLDNEEGQLQALRTDVGSKERKARMKELQRFDNINSVRTSVAKRGGKQQHSMPEIGRFKPKDED